MRFLLFLLIAPLVLFSQSAQDYAVTLTAEVDETNGKITLHWPPMASNSFLVHRKDKSAKSFGIALATLSGSDTSYVDSDVEIGKSYEYSVRSNAGSYTAHGYLNSGIKVPAQEENGKLILVIEKQLSLDLSTEIETFVETLEGEGYTVIEMPVDSTESVKTIRSAIVSEYDKAPSQVKTALLLGHVPVPYSGNLAPDGHSNHVGAWPSDAYYGDVDGNWTDAQVNNVSASDIRNKNTPGDGKFDQSILPSAVELMVARIDFRDLPAFAKSENELFKAYFLKNLAYRKKEFAPVYRGLVDDNFGGFSGEAFAASSWKAFSPMFGLDSIDKGDYFTDGRTKSYAWSYGCGGGTYTSASGIGNTGNFAADSLQSVFTALFGSYFGDWDKTNSFLRAPLAQGLTLTNAWSGRPHWYFHHMALGESIGYSQFLAVNSNPYNNYYFGKYVHIALMGDPTLRMYMVAPPKDLQASEVGNKVELNWTASVDNVLGYNLYRRDTINDVYVKLNDQPIAATTYTDETMLQNGKNWYSVRAVQLQVTPSGSYFNLSSGSVAKASLTYVGMAEEAYANELKIFPIPTKGILNIESNNAFNGYDRLVVHDLAGRVVKNLPMGNWDKNQQQIDLSEQQPGCYFLIFSGMNKQHTEKVLLQ